MDNPTGTIHSLVTGPSGTLAIVDVDVEAACPRCAAGKGCGAGLLTGAGRIRRVEAVVGDDMSLAAGDCVEIGLAPANLLRAAMLAYGLPLAGGVGFAGLAYLWAAGDTAAALAALAGMLLGLMLSRWRLSDSGCINDLVPHIERRLRSARIDA
jgi:sigma-E factor negative regulatory protein RseC